MALGYGGHPHWRDMSEYLVHLTDTLDALTSILRDQTVHARSAYGAIRNHEVLGPGQRVVCMSEIPLDHLDRLADKHGRFGLAFTKRELTPRGAVPVWYLEREGPLQQRLFELVRRSAYWTQPDPDDFLWEVTPFIDYPGIYGDREYKWEWEREWRMRGDLAFALPTLPFLFAPESTHTELRSRWRELAGNVNPPTILDADWPLARLQDVAKSQDL